MSGAVHERSAVLVLLPPAGSARAARTRLGSRIQTARAGRMSASSEAGSVFDAAPAEATRTPPRCTERRGRWNGDRLRSAESGPQADEHHDQDRGEDDVPPP